MVTVETCPEVPTCDVCRDPEVTIIFDLGIVKNGHASWPWITLGLNIGLIGIDVDAKVEVVVDDSDFGTDETKAIGILFNVLILVGVICTEFVFSNFTKLSCFAGLAFKADEADGKTADTDAATLVEGAEDCTPTAGVIKDVTSTGCANFCNEAI